MLATLETMVTNPHQTPDSRLSFLYKERRVGVGFDEGWRENEKKRLNPARAKFANTIYILRGRTNKAARPQAKSRKHEQSKCQK